jgi:hypothetical protein
MPHKKCGNWVAIGALLALKHCCSTDWCNGLFVALLLFAQLKHQGDRDKYIIFIEVNPLKSLCTAMAALILTKCMFSYGYTAQSNQGIVFS